MEATPYDRRREIDALFGQALAQRPEERRAFLEQACTGDPGLLHEVERLLADHAAAEGFLDDRKAWFSTSRLLGLVSDEDDVAAARAGQRVGLYRIVESLGRGGMGAVFLAERDDGLFEKRVALKVVKRGMDTAAIRRRFRYERQILARLEHPNIARLLDGGVTDDGLPYFVMEYVRGEPIDQYCDRKQLPLIERLLLFLTVCEAVQYAHRNLVVHRDLKPSNILVTEPASAPAGVGQVKLLDFGIARLLDDTAQEDAVPITRTGQRWMTPSYAAPEQIRGDPVTTATDVYALGMILYELLTGHRPYQIQGLTPGEVERVVCEQEPTKPSTAVSRLRSTEPERLRRRLKGDLDNIVLKALRKEPERRYTSVEQLAADLRRHLSKRPVLARKPTRRYRLGRFVRRHRIEVTAAMIVVLALAGGLAAALSATYQLEQQNNINLSRRLALQVTTLQEQHHDLSLLLGVQALRIADTYEAKDQLLESLQADSHLAGYLGKEAEIAVLSPDGKTLATSHADSTIRLWDSLTRRLHRTLRTDPPGEVALPEIRSKSGALAFSPDGKMLATIYEDSTLMLWEVATGNPLSPSKRDHALNPRLAFSPDGILLAASSAVDGRILLWEVATLQFAGDLPTGYTNENKGANLAFSPDGRTLASWGLKNEAATGSSNPTLNSITHYWDVATGLSIGQPLTDHTWFDEQAFSPDGSVWVTGDAGRASLVLRDAATAQPLGRTLTGFTSRVKHVAFSPDATRLATGHKDGSVRLWDVRTGRLLSAQSRADGIKALAFSPDGEALIIAEETSLVFWNVATQQVTHRLDGAGFLHHQSLVPDSLLFVLKDRGHVVLRDFMRSQAIGQRQTTPLPVSGRITQTALHPAGKRLALGYNDGTVVLWDVDARHPVGQPFDGHQGALSHLAFSADGKTLVTGSTADGTVRVRDAATRRLLEQPQTGHHRLWGLAFDPARQTLALADSSRITLLDAESLTTRRALLADLAFDGGLSLVFSPNGKQLAATVFPDEGFDIMVWDLATSKPAHPFRPSGQALGPMAFGSNSAVLALGTDQGGELWDFRAGQQVGVLFDGDAGGINAIAFSPDGSLIATAHYDTILLWDTARLLTLGRPLKGHTHTITSLAFSPDGTVLYSAGKDGTVGVWTVGLAAWQEQACRLAHRNLTPTEWHTYLADRPYEETCPALPNL